MLHNEFLTISTDKQFLRLTFLEVEIFHRTKVPLGNKRKKLKLKEENNLKVKSLCVVKKKCEIMSAVVLSWIFMGSRFDFLDGF